MPRPRCAPTSAGWATCSARPWSARRAPSCSTWSSRCALCPGADAGHELAALLEEADLDTAARLVRAFATYFHLANVTEQVHRARELRRRRRGRGRLAGPRRPTRITAAGVDAAGAGRRGAAAGGPAGVHRPPDRGGPPVDPDQAARRSPTLLERRPRHDPRRRPPARRAHRPALADRRAAPRPARAASTRPATRSTTSTSSSPRAVARRARRPGRRAAPGSASRCPPTARPLTFGTWIGGDRDGNPNVTPAVTREVLLLQHEHGIRGAARRWSTTCSHELSISTRGRGVSRRAAASLAARPGGAARARAAASGGSTPRSPTGSSSPACSAKLAQHPRPARRRAPRTSPAATTSARAELLADLRADARLAARAPRRADRRTAGSTGAIRTVARVRPAPGHHGRPRARRRAPRRARPALRPARRARPAVRRPDPRPSAPALLRRELAGRRPLAPRTGRRSTRPAPGRSTSSTRSREALDRFGPEVVRDATSSR